ncbi:MAG: hemolysin family protein [Armatimonadota bacterium]
MMTQTWDIIGILLAALGLTLVSLVEAALVSVSRVRLRQLEEQGHPTASLVEQLLSRSQELLGGLVILVNAFVLLIANLTTALMASSHDNRHGVVWVNLLVLFGILLFCEVIPKTISVHFAEPIALRSARLVYAVNLLLTPVVTVLGGLSILILRVVTALHILPGRIHAVPTAFSEEDIKQLVTAGEQSGEVEASEREMIHGVIEFSQTTAREIMVPRTDLVALPDDASLEEAIHTFLESGHSRLPVYEENADNILGLLYIKDVLIRLKATDGQLTEPFSLTQLLRPAYFVPDAKKSDELLREMQRKQVHMAVVVDEYGGTAGIITIEDLLEEIVGDIIDEYDIERQEVVRMPDGSAMVSGRTSLEKVGEFFDIEMPEDTEAETISGLVTEIMGHIPEVDDHTVIGGVEFTVVEVAHNRAERLRAVVLPPESLPPS